MNFVKHAKTFKPEEPASLQDGDLIVGHSHVHALPVLDEASSLLSYDGDKWATKAYVEEHLKQFIGGPVMMGHALDAPPGKKVADFIHPHDISVSLALESLKYHGVHFENLSFSYHPQQDVKIEATMFTAGPEVRSPSAKCTRG